MRYPSLARIAGLALVCPAWGQSGSPCPRSCEQYQGEIQRLLSANTTLKRGEEDVRWSGYAAPNPGAIITVGTEDDVAEVVSYASRNNIPFLVQSGANGWADTFTLGTDGLVIDISQLKAVSFNSNLTQVTFQAGKTNENLIDAAWASNARVSTATCNCVSVLGSALGGGLSRIAGLYGVEADQLLSIT
jgi:FAD/FMN-containing dehydrogenase